MEVVGDVLRSPFGALKRICEENSTSSIIGNGIIRRFEQMLGIKIGEKDNKSLFDKSTVKKYAELGKEVLVEFENEKLEDEELQV